MTTLFSMCFATRIGTPTAFDNAGIKFTKRISGLSKVTGVDCKTKPSVTASMNSSYKRK